VSGSCDCVSNVNNYNLTECQWLLRCNCVVVQRAISVLSDNKEDNDNDDVKMPLLNPVVVSMLALPLLQIVSLPRTITEHSDREHTARDDCRTTAKNLLTAVHHYVTQHQHHPCRHGDAEAGALQVMPSAVSHTCRAYVQLARYLSVDLYSSPVGDNGVVNEWLQQVRSLLSADLQPSMLLTQLVASLFLIHDDTTTVDSCLQLLHAICQADKTQVCYSNVLSYKLFDVSIFVCYYYQWHDGAMIRVLDLQPILSGFESQPLRFTNGPGQVVHTHVPLSPSSINWYRPKGGDALWLRR